MLKKDIGEGLTLAEQRKAIRKNLAEARRVANKMWHNLQDGKMAVWRGRQQIKVAGAKARLQK